MMNSINLMGRLTRDPEYSETMNGTTKAVFCLAVDRDHKAQGAEKVEADFINCIAWGKTADMIDRYFKKGQLCGLTGRLEIRQYTDDNNNRRSYTQVRVASIYFGQSKKDSARDTSEESEPVLMEPQFTELEGDDSDLPF